MFTMEKKVDLVLRYIASGNKTQQAELKKAIIEALNDGETKGVPAVSSVDVEMLIVDILKKVGMPPHLKGYNYVVRAVLLCLSDSSYLDQITYRLYPDIAKEFDTTPSRVERAIRHAVEVVFDRGDPDYIFEVFGNTMSTKKGKLTNSEFIATITNDISLRLKARGITKV
jgi:two-component system response regulator (stage 0 sporulation protein A)